MYVATKRLDIITHYQISNIPNISLVCHSTVDVMILLRESESVVATSELTEPQVKREAAKRIRAGDEEDTLFLHHHRSRHRRYK
jgi:hypothetical protein